MQTTIFEHKGHKYSWVPSEVEGSIRHVATLPSGEVMDLNFDPDLVMFKEVWEAYVEIGLQDRFSGYPHDHESVYRYHYQNTLNALTDFERDQFYIIEEWVLENYRVNLRSLSPNHRTDYIDAYWRVTLLGENYEDAFEVYDDDFSEADRLIETVNNSLDFSAVEA